MRFRLLSRRVVELVFSGSLEALLHTAILPKGLNRTANLGRQNFAFNLGGLHEDGLDVVLHALVFQRELQRLHGLEDNTHRLNSIAEDDLFERFAFIARVASLMDKLHLFKNGGLAGFTSTYRRVSVSDVS